MELSFKGALLSAGAPSELVERRRGEKSGTTIPVSTVPRGLALRSLTVSRKWDWLWNFFNRRQQIYFISIAMDLSGAPPTVFPLAKVPADAIYQVRHGQSLVFSLGEGSPIYPPRLITGGLIVYVIVSEADKGARHLGETMKKIHADISASSLTDKLVRLVRNPTASIVDEVMSVASAALRPIATILEQNEDDCVGLFNGYYRARGPWSGKLEASQNGTTISLGEVR